MTEINSNAPAYHPICFECGVDLKYSNAFGWVCPNDCRNPRRAKADDDGVSYET